MQYALPQDEIDIIRSLQRAVEQMQLLLQEDNQSLQQAGQTLDIWLRTVNSASWISIDPYVDVLVGGERLRVDIAARLVVSGVNLRIGMSYGVTGPTDQPGGGGAVVQAPNEARALLLKSNGNVAFSEMAAGMPDLVTGITDPGWYRVQAYGQLYGEDNLPGDTTGNLSNRRIFATPM
jgi:hypothetical protein